MHSLQHAEQSDTRFPLYSGILKSWFCLCASLLAGWRISTGGSSAACELGVATDIARACQGDLQRSVATAQVCTQLARRCQVPEVLRNMQCNPTQACLRRAQRLSSACVAQGGFRRTTQGSQGFIGPDLKRVQPVGHQQLPQLRATGLNSPQRAMTDRAERRETQDWQARAQTNIICIVAPSCRSIAC